MQWHPHGYHWTTGGGRGRVQIEVKLARRPRVGVPVSPLQRAILAAVVEPGGYGDQAGALRALGIQGARELLARTAPAKLAEIDRRFGGAE